MDAALNVENLTKTYSDFKLDRVSFRVPYGNIVGLIGENGAGKTTTIKAILNLISTDSGNISVLGNSNMDSASIREKVGVVFDENCFHDNLTPSKIGKIMKNMYDQWDMQLFNKYCLRFQLPTDKKIGTFSKGMKMKLAITVALSHSPQLLVLDEATSGLDPVMRDEILDVFLEFIQDEKHSILLSSHITSDLEKVADYIVFLHKGQTIFTQPKDTLIYQYGIIRCRTNEFEQISQTDILAYQKKDFEWEVLVADKEKAAQKYRKFTIDNASLEEIMLLYIKGEKPCEV